MSQLDDAVRVLLSETPPRPGLEDLEGRARRRRIRHATTIVVSAVVIAVATVGVVGTLGRGANSPQVAVSPTSGASRAACPIDRLRQRQDDLKAREAELDKALVDAENNDLPNRDAIDARHQAVLRQLEDVMFQILSAQTDEAAKADPGSTTTPVNPDTCESTTTTSPVEAGRAWCEVYTFLNRRRVQLKNYAESLNVEEGAAITANSPDLGPLDAEHQAVLRELEDIETRLIRLAQVSPVPRPTCP